jgi:hypothetical protein
VRRTKSLRIRLTEDEHLALSKLPLEADMSVSKYVRTKLFEGEPQPHAAALRSSPPLRAVPDKSEPQEDQESDSKRGGFTFY